MVGPDDRSDDPIALLAHDLMTPLAVIQGFAETLVARADVATQAEIREWSEIILSKTQAMAAQIKELARGGKDAGTRRL